MTVKIEPRQLLPADIKRLEENGERNKGERVVNRP
jgi:hypothetical protein